MLPSKVNILRDSYILKIRQGALKRIFKNCPTSLIFLALIILIVSDVRRYK